MCWGKRQHIWLTCVLLRALVYRFSNLLPCLQLLGFQESFSYSASLSIPGGADFLCSVARAVCIPWAPRVRLTALAPYVRITVLGSPWGTLRSVWFSPFLSSFRNVQDNGSVMMMEKHSEKRKSDCPCWRNKVSRITTNGGWEGAPYYECNLNLKIQVTYSINELKTMKSDIYLCCQMSGILEHGHPIKSWKSPQQNPTRSFIYFC